MEKHYDKEFLNKLYYIEDMLEEYAKNDIDEVYLEHFTNKENIDSEVSAILESLLLICETSPWKISPHLKVLCPKCKNRVENFKYGEQISFREEILCRKCGIFTRETKNTYIYFEINKEWINWLKNKSNQNNLEE